VELYNFVKNRSGVLCVKDREKNYTNFTEFKIFKQVPSNLSAEGLVPFAEIAMGFEEFWDEIESQFGEQQQEGMIRFENVEIVDCGRYYFGNEIENSIARGLCLVKKFNDNHFLLIF